MNKIALVTGVTGQLGAVFAADRLKKGDSIIGMVRRVASPNYWRLKELDILDHENLQFCSGDLTDQNSIDFIMSKYKPDYVLNAGAQSFVGASWDIPLSTMDITGNGPIRIYESVRKYVPGAKIIQCSSSEMFGHSNRQEMLTEESSFLPQSIYGVAKVAAHYAAEVYRKSYNLWISCPIMFNYEGSWRGEEFITRKITKGVAEIKLGLRDYISIGCLDACRDWNDCNNVVDAINKILEIDNPDDYIVSTSRVHSIAELCHEAFRNIGVKDWRQYIKINEKYQRKADVKYLLGSYEKIKNKTGWEPKITFEEMIKTMVIEDIKRVGKEKDNKCK